MPPLDRHNTTLSSLTGELCIRPMIAADIATGMRLKHNAGWNQTRADWARFLASEPRGCFAAAIGHTTVATVVYCRFPPVAWIGMMLVDPRYRRRGIAGHMMQFILQRLDALGMDRVRLDATSLARPLYGGLGFQPQMQILRYGGRPCGPLRQDDLLPIQSFRWHQWRQLLALDTAAARVDRTKLLKRLLVEPTTSCRLISSDGRLAGFVIDRPGSQAMQIGPLIASSEPVGRSLLGDTLRRYRGRDIFVDIPEDNSAARRVVEQAGLTIARDFTRMCRGRPCREVVASLWAGSGPEKG